MVDLLAPHTQQKIGSPLGSLFSKYQCMCIGARYLSHWGLSEVMTREDLPVSTWHLVLPIIP